MPNSLPLRYGTNPHQHPADVSMPTGGPLPFVALNGSPGYINLLDALNGWALVSELSAATGLPAAATFKHVSPSGVALGLPLAENDALAQALFVTGEQLSPIAAAYARARGTDRMSSFGDLIALSHPCDESAARLIAREVSDGVIAPAYSPEALRLLAAKKGGKYLVLQMDPAYQPGPLEHREVYGVRFSQARHTRGVDDADLANLVTANKALPPDALRDLKLAWITLKYTQSNSVCLAKGGQTLGVGAGQQSRVHCVRLAASKADLWTLRQHPRVLGLPFADGIKRPDRDNAIDQFLQPDLTDAERANWNNVFRVAPQPLTPEERREWLAQQSGVVLASDAFFPFRDSIDRAALSGVAVVMQPGGSARDADVIAACDEYGMAMLFTGVRLFHH